MLTKDLLKFSVRQGKVFPKLLDTQDKASQDIAGELIAVFDQAQGKRLGDLGSYYLDLVRNAPPYALGFVKLLERRLMTTEGEDLEEFRTKALGEAQRLREQEFTFEEFEQKLASVMGFAISNIRERLYGDLPEFASIQGFKTISAHDLLAKYNVSLVQGLLLHARSMKIQLNRPNPLESRFLFRKLKEHQLLAEISHSASHSILEVSGPLAFSDSGQAYGLRLARFFKDILPVSSWSLGASLTLRDKEARLELDPTEQFFPVKKGVTEYTPEEFSSFANAFNELGGPWTIRLGESLMNLGGGQYSFPDWQVVNKKRQVSVELFHKWHRSSLVRRLEFLTKNPCKDYIIGVDRVLIKGGDLVQILDRAAESGVKHFTFSGIPTAKAVLTHLV